MCKVKYSVMSVKKVFAGDKLDLLRQEVPWSLCSWQDHVPVPSAASPSSRNMKITQGELLPPCQLSMDLPASDITLSLIYYKCSSSWDQREHIKTYQSFNSIPCCSGQDSHPWERQRTQPWPAEVTLHSRSKWHFWALSSHFSKS